MASDYLGTLYTGVTSDLVARVVQHREGTYAGFATQYDVKRLVWYENGASMESVIAAEKRIKRWRRDWKIELIERDNPHWSDLGPAIGLPSL